ncbi:hypothetical protein J2Z69_000741 [Paenibacillus shirakamiensis]|uniref:Inhibitor of sigma-G Gin n=1 Tax=Paenibacillus shirakamiensis TaxID=1265935 RepID=A0ABS4JDC3_9BACL|nr:hypothetical protein [Paenibacillus shirakamiensis]
MMCGCEMNLANYEVYEDKQPHCLSCMLDAVDCRDMVLVRRLEPYANRREDKV